MTGSLRAVFGGITIGLFWLVMFGGIQGVESAQAAYRICNKHNPPKPIELEECLERTPYAMLGETPILEEVALPDLQTLPPYDFRLIYNRGTGERTIRFSNSVWNRGEGVMELRGVLDRQNGVILVSQYLYGAKGVIMRPVGDFEFHEVHNHWHWENFSLYEIWSTGPDGELTEMVVSSGKVGYCMYDTHPIHPAWLEGAPISEADIPQRPGYRACGWRLQGISIGWVDTYDWDTAGQALNVTHLEDGRYALLSTVDPDGILSETSKDNNSALIYFSLQGDTLLLE